MCMCVCVYIVDQKLLEWNGSEMFLCGCWSSWRTGLKLGRVLFWNSEGIQVNTNMLYFKMTRLKFKR